MDERPAASIKVVGCGGGGGNALNRMVDCGVTGVDFIAVNTDVQALRTSRAATMIQIGEKLTKGLGAGATPEIGKKAAEESREEIASALKGADLVFVTAGMGGGTGTGASPVIAKLAREMELLTVAIVTSPLAVEGLIRYDQAIRGIEELRKNVDAVLIINNDSILEIYGDLSLGDAFRKADDILASAAKGIAEIITVKSDLVNVDFADVSNVMHNKGRIHMAVATADGENRAKKVAEASLHSPLLDHNQITGAKNILLHISVAKPNELKASEVTSILEYIQSHASVKDGNGVIHSANIIWGTSQNPQLGDAIQLMIVATGFDEDPAQAILPSNRKIITPVEAESTPTEVAKQLEPVKQRASTPFPTEPIVLGEKSARYKDINQVKSTPAYQTRNSKFVVQAPGTHKESMQQQENASAAQSATDETQLPFSSN